MRNIPMATEFRSRKASPDSWRLPGSKIPFKGGDESRPSKKDVYNMRKDTHPLIRPRKVTAYHCKMRAAA